MVDIEEQGGRIFEADDEGTGLEGTLQRGITSPAVDRGEQPAVSGSHSLSEMLLNFLDFDGFFF